MSLEPGSVIGERYRIEGHLGGGGFGTVFRATQLNLGRPVAIKVLHAGLAMTESALARFRREAELAQRLTHPNTVRVFDFGQTEQGFPFIVWEHLDGMPLDQLLAHHGPLAPARVARIASQILKALMEAHGAGIVHRDIKPANVILCDFTGEPDFVKILDFGVAKALESSGGTVTEGASPVGTPSYMAPEQVRNETITPATDLYALGLMLAELLTGRVVFQGRSVVEVFMAQAAQDPAPIPAEVLASPLAPIILRATQKHPAYRYASAAEMLADVERVAASGQLEGAAAWHAAREISIAPPTPISPYGAQSAVAPTLGATAGAQVVTAAPVTQRSSSVPVAVAVFAGLLVVGLLLAGTATALFWASRSEPTQRGAAPGGATPTAGPTTVATPEATPPQPANDESTELGARSGKGFEGMGASTIRKKLASTGWQPLGDTVKNLEGTYTETRVKIAKADRGGVVSIFRFDETEEAEKFEPTARAPADSAVARQEATVLRVEVTGDRAEAMRLLTLLRR